MEPALDTLNRALHGDAEARSLLERTTSSYILDNSDSQNPKTYGCWNFIHQAMNEVERYEARFIQEHRTYQFPQDYSLVPHARLLTSMALRVARRSPARDKELVAECLAQADGWNGSQDQVRWLEDLNLELREIVMGRVAAMAFDFSFHRKNGPNGYSAFADRLVMNSFSSILSANAVSTGPSAIHFFATQWVIPSAKNIPSFSLASVVYNLALEAMRKNAPAGTKNLLQQLSARVMSFILAPTLCEAIDENSETATGTSSHKDNSDVAAMCLAAMKVWCQATELSIAQIKHVCAKVDINIVAALSDAMYSDSADVVDSVAELVEYTVQAHTTNSVSLDRVDQVRYIIDVDETLFREVFSIDQFKSIESRELSVITGELASAIGMQRFRFVERQSAGKLYRSVQWVYEQNQSTDMNIGDEGVCRNLTRIAVAVSMAFLETSDGQAPDNGVINFLLKAATHSSYNISGMAVETLAEILKTSHGLLNEILRVIQQSAVFTRITLTDDNTDTSIEAFLEFREHFLTNALRVCWEIDSRTFMRSCAHALQAGEESLENREAAIFCIEAVSDDLLMHQSEHWQDIRKVCTVLKEGEDYFMHNELMIIRTCSFVSTYASLLSSDDIMESYGSIVLNCLHRVVANRVSAQAGDYDQDSIWIPFRAAAGAIKVLVDHFVHYFDNRSRFDKLWDIWQKISRFDGVLATEGRLDVAKALGSIMVCTGEVSQRLDSVQYVLQDCISRCSKLLASIDSSSERNRKKVKAIASEIACMATICHSFTDGNLTGGRMNSGITSSEASRAIPGPLWNFFHRNIGILESTISLGEKDEACFRSVGLILEEMLPSSCTDEESLFRTKSLIPLVDKLIAEARIELVAFESICSLLERFVSYHGELLEKLVRGEGCPNQAQEFGQVFEECVVKLFDASRGHLGSAWSCPKEQIHGEPAIETKGQPSPSAESLSTDFLPRALSLIAFCTRKSPSVMTRIGARSGSEKEAESLLRCAVDSAVSVLRSTNAELVGPSLVFLKSMSPHEELRRFVLESCSRIRSCAIDHLIVGFCGEYESSLLDDSTEVLSLFLQSTPPEDLEGICSHALQTENFCLGDQTRAILLQLLLRCGRGEAIYNYLLSFLEECLALHQAEERRSLPASDHVARLNRIYGSPD